MPNICPSVVAIFETIPAIGTDKPEKAILGEFNLI